MQMPVTFKTQSNIERDSVSHKPQGTTNEKSTHPSQQPPIAVNAGSSFSVDSLCFAFTQDCQEDAHQDSEPFLLALPMYAKTLHVSGSTNYELT